MFISIFVIQILHNIQNAQEGKRHQKKDIKFLSFQIVCFCLCSFCFRGEVSNSWILNDIGRNSLLGNRKKIAKFLMRTFTCRSTYLYGSIYLLPVFRWAWAALRAAFSWTRRDTCSSRTRSRGPWSGRPWRPSAAASYGRLPPHPPHLKGAYIG